MQVCVCVCVNRQGRIAHATCSNCPGTMTARHGRHVLPTAACCPYDASLMCHSCVTHSSLTMVMAVCWFQARCILPRPMRAAHHLCDPDCSRTLSRT